jgi:hypothetical protein
LGEAITSLEGGVLAAGSYGGGWTYAVRPNWSGNQDAEQVGTAVHRTLETLRREGVWLAGLNDGRLLIAPPVDSSAADIARIVDGLHTGLSIARG